MQLSGREVIEAALAEVGEILALQGSSCSIVVLGGAALNLHGIVDRPTIDVDVLAQEQEGRLVPPDPLPNSLQSAIVAIARSRGLLDHWMNTAVAGQWRVGLPPGLAERVAWRTYGGLRVGLVGRRDLIFFKLYASADQTGPDDVHVRDLLALRPTASDLEDAAEWVRSQDPSPGFQEVLAKVVSYVDGALR